MTLGDAVDGSNGFILEGTGQIDFGTGFSSVLTLSAGTANTINASVSTPAITQFQITANTGSTINFSGALTGKTSGSGTLMRAINSVGTINLLTQPTNWAGYQLGSGTIGLGVVSPIGTDTSSSPSTFTQGNYAFLGSAEVNSGTLVAGNANAFGASGTVAVNAGGVFAVGGGVTFHNPVTYAASSGLAGEGTQSRGGGWTLPSNFTIAPGFSEGTVTIDLADGELTMDATTVTEIEIGALDYDVLALLGSGTLAGGLSVALLDGYKPAFGETFDVITSTLGLSGSVNLIGPNGAFFIAAIVGDNLQLTSQIPEPASGLLLLLGGLLAFRRRQTSATARPTRIGSTTTLKALASRRLAIPQGPDLAFRRK